MYYDDNPNYYEAEPVSEPTGVSAETPEEKAPKKKAKKLPVRVAVIALVCALIGGCLGAALQSMPFGTVKTAITKSNRPLAEVQTVQVDGKTQMSLPEVYRSTVNSVVSITARASLLNAFSQTVESTSLGSGFVITTDGYIVTNDHVIDDADSVQVTLYNGETYKATVIGGDEEYDIAVLKIDAKDLPAVVIGDSSAIAVGETVAAIGNPLGQLTFSMSHGIISCANRAITVEGAPFNMIQVDCSINPGNSGGPLMNTYGEVIGIVSAKYQSYFDTTVEGIGFAIPINDVTALIEDIMTNGKATNKPYFGINAGTLTETMAQQYRYTVSEGAFIYSVDEGSAATKAGLRMGDVILKIDDIEIKTMNDLTAAKKNYSAGDTVTLTIYREGKTMQVKLTFDAVPEEEEQTVVPEQQPQQPQQMPNGDNGGGYYYYNNPWDFFNNFFGGHYGR